MNTVGCLTNLQSTLGGGVPLSRRLWIIGLAAATGALIGLVVVIVLSLSS